MESLLKDLKKHLECSICHDTFKEPKTISCLHTFCCQCLENQARASHRQGKFRCPECQAQIDLPAENRFDTLPTSFFHNSLLGLLAVRRCGDESEMTCSQCRRNNSQMYYCFDCARFLCPDCYNAHEMLRELFEGHKVTPVKDFKAEDYEALLKRQPFCPKQFHEKHKTEFFCFYCNDCVCLHCIATEHRSECHEVKSLDTAALAEIPNIKSGAENIKERVEELKEEIRQFEETSSELEENFEDAKREVSETAKRMVEKIKESEQEALASLEATLKKRQKKITLAEKEANSLIKQMKQAIEFADNLAERSSSSNIMRNKDTLKQRNEELRRVEVRKQDATTFIKFSPASVEALTVGAIETAEKEADDIPLVPVAAKKDQWSCGLM